MKLRPYQRDAVNSVFDYYRSGETGNPIVVMPTGAGKAVTISATIRESIEKWPSVRFMVITHVKELVEQNGAEICRYWPEAKGLVGYYNAAMGKRDTESQVVFASIQSVYKRAHEFGDISLVMIDECHLCPPRGDGMYRKFLAELRELCPRVKVVGYSATPYRLGSGMLHKGKGAIFTDICYSADIKELIRDGYLAPLTTTLAKERVDLSSVKVRGGEYVAGELEAAMGDADVVRAAVAETVRLAADRRKWLVFCAGVDHAFAVRDAMRAAGVSAETITGDTDKVERERLVQAFKRGEFRALTNVNVLTTGFNVPDVDCLVLLRPTKSTGLHVQMLGRGMRTAPGKTDCLVLDFCGNVLEHGPIDQIEIKSRQGGDSAVSTAPQKQCPECGAVCAIAARECPECGHEYETNAGPRHGDRAHLGAHVITPDTPEWIDVDAVEYRRHTKPGKPDSLRVDYVAGLTSISEWVCLEHDGYARRKAEQWWALRHDDPAPGSISAALEVARELREPCRVLVDESGKYPRILRADFSDPDGKKR